MKRISFFALAALLCAGLTATACKGASAGTTARAAEPDYIAKTIFEFIPKADLPDYCAHAQQTDYSLYDPADVPAFDPTFFAGNVEGSQVEGMDGGFYGYINVKCYPLKDGGWRAYWVAYGGYDGLCGYDRSGAYNYVDGKLTKEEIWLLPTPPVDEMLSADLRDQLIESGDYGTLSDPHPNYSYSFGSGEDGVLSVNLDVDYLFYAEEGPDGSYTGTTFDIDYGWTGERLTRQDFDALDDVQMNGIIKILGFNDPETYYIEDGGFKVFDPEEDEWTGRTTYYNYVQTYAELDELGMASSWKVFNYDLASRELKVYDFDGTHLTPSKHMIVDDWNATKANEPDAFVWLSPVVVRFCAPRGDVVDEPIATYNYDSSCDGLFEPEDLFEE